MYKKFFLKIPKFFLGFLSFNSLIYIYAHIFKPKPLRNAVNFVIKKFIPQTVILPEGVLRLNQNDPVVSGAIAFGKYEPFFTSIFKKFLRPDIVLVDVGANIGYYSIIASKYLTEGMVISFEPDDTNRNFLMESITLNNIKNIRTVEFAVGDKVGVEKFHIHSFNKGKHSFVPDENHEYENINVPVTKLDVFLPQINVHKVGMIKIDVEGWEARAIQGMTNILKRDHPVLLFEYAPERIKASNVDPNDMLKELIDYGYTLYKVSEEKQLLEKINNFHEFTMDLNEWDKYENICALYEKN